MVLFEQCVHKDHEDIIMYSQTYFYLCMPKAQQVATQQGLMHRISIVSRLTSGGSDLTRDSHKHF